MSRCWSEIFVDIIAVYERSYSIDNSVYQSTRLIPDNASFYGLVSFTTLQPISVIAFRIKNYTVKVEN